MTPFYCMVHQQKEIQYIRQFLLEVLSGSENLGFKSVGSEGVQGVSRPI